jgi:hypothetical protein
MIYNCFLFFFKRYEVFKVFQGKKKTINCFFQYSYKIDKKEEDEEGKEESIL